MTLYLHELKRELLSARSVITIALMVSLAIGTSKASSVIDAIGGSGIQVNGLLIAYALFAQFFVGLIFSGIFAYDIETQAIRYVLPYMSRVSMFLAKYLAVISYFLITIALALITVAITGNGIRVDWKTLFVLLLTYMYAAAVTSSVSLAAGKQRMATFVSLLCGVGLPVLGIMSLVWISNPGWHVIAFLTPYHYMDLAPEYSLILAALVLMMVGGCLALFLRKDI